MIQPKSVSNTESEFPIVLVLVYDGRIPPYWETIGAGLIYSLNLLIDK